MAQKVTTPNLALQLDRVFQVQGGVRGPNELESGAPAQPVFDLMRTAELSRIVTDPGAAGLFQIGQDNVHAAADTMTASMDPYTTISASWGVPGQRWVWLMTAALSATAAQVTSAQLSVGIGALGAAFAIRDFLIAAWTGSISIHNASASFDQAGVGTDTVVSPFTTGGRPFPLPPGSTLRFRSVAAAACTIRVQTICWIGPFGVYPPGMH